MIDTTTKSRFSVKQLTVIYTIISLLSLLVVWELAARFTSASMFLPPASQVLASFCRSFVEPIGKHTMLVHIGVSLYRVAVAFFFATVTGIALGVGMGYSRLLEAILKPLFEFIRPIPPLAWIPLSIVWFGFDEGSKYFLIFLACFFTIALTTYNGVHSVDETLVRAARMLGAKDNQLFTSIVLPTTVPYIFSGLQVALGSAWATIVAAEMIRSSEGVGWLIISGQEVGNMTQIMVGIVAIALTGLLITSIMRGVESKLCAWTVRGK